MNKKLDALTSNKSEIHITEDVQSSHLAEFQKR